MKKTILTLLLLAAFLAPAAARSQETPAAPQATEPDRSLGLTIDVGLASAYLFRGLNVFAEDGMMDQKAFVAPSLTWTGLDGRLAVGYWGAWQVVGDNVGSKIDSAAGAENDLVVTWNHPLAEGLTFSPGATFYFYPLADEAVAGTSVPTVIEPVVGLAWASVLDFGLKASYFIPAQQAIQSWRYLYLNPTVGKSIGLTDHMALSGSAGFGYKALADFDDNVLDALLNVAAPITYGKLTVKPALNLAWTNGEALGFGDELAFFGSVNVAYSL